MRELRWLSRCILLAVVMAPAHGATVVDPDTCPGTHRYNFLPTGQGEWNRVCTTLDCGEHHQPMWVQQVDGAFAEQCVVPPKLRKDASPRWPKSGDRNRTTRVVLQGLIDVAGEMTNVEVIKVRRLKGQHYVILPDHEGAPYARSAADAMARRQYSPAKRNQTAVAVLYSMQIDFRP